MNKEELFFKIKEKEEEKEKIERELDELKEQYKRLVSECVNSLTKDEKIAIFADYFKGRTDVYPYLSFDKKDPTKKYYRPTCLRQGIPGICQNLEGGKCKNCPYKGEYKPLTLETIKNHMYKGETIGIYPLLKDETCYFLAFDFDDKKDENNLIDDVRAFRQICFDYEIPIAIERSRSGKGIHAWLFFKENVEAVDARKLGKLLLSKTMEVRDNLGVESYDRMFPNQDFMPKGGFGNLIALPFQTEPSKSFNTLFLDENFNPYINQFEYLRKLKKLTKEELLEKIKILSHDTIDISDINLDLKEKIQDIKDDFKYPKTINVTLDNMVLIEKKNLTAKVKNSFKRLAKFPNPEFYQKQKARLSVWNTPTVIDCSKEDDKYLKIPRGRYEYLVKLCDTKNIKIKLKDIRNNGTKINVHFQGELRNDQELALNKMLEYENGILEAPTSFGKTVVLCKLISERQVNTLIIVEKLQLANQWQDRLKSFLDISEVGEFNGTKKKTTNIIDIATIKSIWNNGKLNDIVNNYGMIIIDECHHIAAYTYENAINAFNSKYVYGVSATPEKENGHTPIIEMQCGDIRYKVNAKEFNKNLNLAMKVYVKKTRLSFVDMSITDYSLNEIKDFIVKDYIRNNKIIDDIKKEFMNKKNILVLTERIEHLNYFKEKLEGLTNNLLIYQGGIGKKKLREYDKIRAEIAKREENKIIIATGSCLGEGFDDSNLDVLFITMPISGIVKVKQYTGRLHRKNATKKEIIVYDYVDDNFNITRSMFEKRKKTYIKLGYDVIEKFEQCSFQIDNL